MKLKAALWLCSLAACAAQERFPTTPETRQMHAGAEDVTARARAFIAAHEEKVRPLEKRLALAWWSANVSGKDEDFAAKEAAQNALDAALADRDAWRRLQELGKGAIADPLVARQIGLLTLACLEKQVDPALLRRMTAKSTAIEQAFNVYRAHVDGGELTENEVRKLLKASRDPAQLKRVWEASKGVGAAVEKDLRELVGLRNEAARELGFADYHVLQLHLNEQEQSRVLQLFDELDELTRAPFAEAKAGIDQKLARLYGIDVADLRPWHYQDPFFQEAPAVFGMDLDAVWRSQDILALCRTFYAGIGLPIDDVIARSDLYEKPGKSPHAFCLDVDREGDVRVLGNIVPNDYWMSTMLHELGHAVYSSRNIPESLPWLLRTEAHILVTEGVAMMFERLCKRAPWLAALGVEVDDDQAFAAAATLTLQNRLLIFSRWCQVMLRFEQALYAKPDQDLNELWWDLVERYQLVRRPDGRDAPDYASKIHLVVAPVYYHNYMMGELFASQLHHAIAREALGGQPPDGAVYAGRTEVGRFLRERVFAPGRSLPWNELTKHATGAGLNARAFAQDFRDQR